MFATYYLRMISKTVEAFSLSKNMTEDFSLKALVLGAIRLSASVKDQRLLRP